ncbi:MAG: hypothetical protein RL295_49 [Pseudomonadota bacterium]
MRLDQPITDASGLPQLARSPLAFARSAPAFTRALAAAQMQPNGTLEVPASAAQLIASASSELGGATSAQAWVTTVRSGQTLSGIVREQMAQRGVNVSNGEALRLAQMVAQSNKMPNANLIHPGQQLNLDSLNLSLQQGLAVKSATQVAIAQNNANFNGPLPNASINSATQIQLLNKGDRTNNPVLEKTLDRAIEKGFIPASDKQAVMNKIIQLSIQHRFAPDDFARLTLMESDGMNPKASNSRCHGIIQFCDGPDRGAASAGFGSNPRAILNHSVLQQLDMVDKYFEETGLKNYGPAGLDDLYLTVLTPAARNETRPNVALNIQGQQAAYLHVNRDVRAPITRNSILAGLHQNANDRLLGSSQTAQQRNNALQAARLSAYAEQASITQVR